MIFLYLLIMIAIFSALMVGMVKLTTLITGRAVGRTVEKIHRDAEFIINAGSLPESWKGEAASFTTFPRYEKYLGKKFRKMERHFQNAPVFDEEATRRTLLSQLQEKKDLFGKEEFWTEWRKKMD